ncbi:hypothetical protein LA080_013511 [Diaporthe eres]|nr:hypothetical protein LA080_013511 [Diaporthe eres]
METPACAADMQQAKYGAEGGWKVGWQAKLVQGPNMAPMLATQPLKAVYATYFLLTIPVRAIYLYLKYLAKPLDLGWNATSKSIHGLVGPLPAGRASKVPDLPLLGGFIVFSPWVSVTAHAGAEFERRSNHESDILNVAFLQWGAESYLLSMGRLPANVEAFISPIHHPFPTSVPIFIWAGAAEAFCGDIKPFADEMANAQGNRVRFSAQEKAAHDLLMNLSLFKLEKGFYAAMRQA